MCAQKRPIDAFLNAAKQYQYRQQDSTNKTKSNNIETNNSSTNYNLPDYLIIGDDDTWVNLNHVSKFIVQAYPKHEPHAVAGCLVRSAILSHKSSFPFGGFGLILSQKTIHNFFRPLNCSNVVEPLSLLEDQISFHDYDVEDTDFEKLACWRVGLNGIGEKPLFRDGMSVADLMQAYSMASPFTKVHEWQGVGFCMHSDWVWGYFVNYYHLSSNTHDPLFAAVFHNRLGAYNGSQFYAGLKSDPRLLRECLHSNSFRGKNHDQDVEALNADPFCGRKAHLCHRISPERMRHLHIASNRQQLL